MKIATWNVNGIRARESQFIEWVGRDRPDVICLQEIKAAVSQVPSAICEMPDYWCYWHGERAYSGVGLHVRREAFAGAQPEFSHPAFDNETRIVTARIGRLVVGSVYVPNGGKDFPAKIRFLEAMDRYVEETHGNGLELVLCGDINIARTDMDVHPKERKPVIGQLPEERELFERILAKGLVDVGRALDPANENLFTWWAPWRNLRQRNIGWRLDYVLATRSLAERASFCAVLAQLGTSDHAPVVAEFQERRQEAGNQ